MDTEHEVDIDGGWGEYLPTLEAGLASCADYLGQLQRSLSGNAAPHPYFFSSRAHDLYGAARDLVRLVEEVEARLIVCGEPVLAGSNSAAGAACELPRNHYGDHDAEPLPSLAVQVRDAARALMDRAEDAAWYVNLLGRLSDERRAYEIEKPFDPEFGEVYFDLEQTSRFLISHANKVAEVMQELVYAIPPDEEFDEDWGDEDEDGGEIVAPERSSSPYLPPAPKRARGLDL